MAVMQDFIMKDPYDNWSAASAKLKKLYNWLEKNEKQSKIPAEKHSKGITI